MMSQTTLSMDIIYSFQLIVEVAKGNACTLIPKGPLGLKDYLLWLKGFY